jgi:hypothetical protein
LGEGLLDGRSCGPRGGVREDGVIFDVDDIAEDLVFASFGPGDSLHVGFTVAEVAEAGAVGVWAKDLEASLGQLELRAVFILRAGEDTLAGEGLEAGENDGIELAGGGQSDGLEPQAREFGVVVVVNAGRGDVVEALGLGFPLLAAWDESECAEAKKPGDLARHKSLLKCEAAKGVLDEKMGNIERVEKASPTKSNRADPDAASPPTSASLRTNPRGQLNENPFC